MALMKEKEAMKIYSELDGFGPRTLEFIKKLTEDTERAKNWMDAERKLRHMREVYEQISDISWEEKSEQLWELSNDAECEVNTLVTSVNIYREHYGIEKADEV